MSVRQRITVIVLATSSACGGDGEKDVSCSGATVMSVSDLAPLADCTVITSNLIFTGDALERVSLPNLQEIRATLEVREASNLTDVSMPALVKTAPFTLADNPLLNNLDLGALASTNNVYIYGNSALTSLDLPQLETVQGNLGLFIFDNSALSDLNMPSLISVSGAEFAITGNENLPTSEAEALADQLEDYQGTVSVEDNAP